jgi:hypothetical protein
MWEKYAPSSDGVALHSTLKRVRGAIQVKQEFAEIGRVKYVDLSIYDMIFI